MTGPHDHGLHAAGRPEARGSLEELARLYGIDCAYDDAFGTHREVSDTTLFSLLRALGVPVSGAKDVGPALDARRRQLAERVVEPVAVAWDGHLELPVRLAESARGDPGPIELTVELEGGDARRWTLDPQPAAYWKRTGGQACRKEGGGVPVAAATHVLRPPEELPLGYHTLRLSGSPALGSERRSPDVFVISAPRKAYGADLSDRGLRWGTFLPLYALRTERSWGTGDLTDLERLVEWTRGSGRLPGRHPAALRHLPRGGARAVRPEPLRPGEPPVLERAVRRSGAGAGAGGRPAGAQAPGVEGLP